MIEMLTNGENHMKYVNVLNQHTLNSYNAIC